MVKREEWKGKTTYTCESCGFGYLTETLAQQCEDYCTTHKSCSLEITRQAVKT